MLFLKCFLHVHNCLFQSRKLIIIFKEYDTKSKEYRNYGKQKIILMYTMNVYDDDVYNEISNVIKRNKSETEFLIKGIYFY